MILTGETIGAAEALAIGLVDRVASVDRFAAEVERTASELAGVAFASAIESKRIANRAFDPGYEDVLAAYLDGQERSMASPEHTAAMAAWRDRRSGGR
jgi:enoyl-CoA hydratase/carnithine racemase